MATNQKKASAKPDAIGQAVGRLAALPPSMDLALAFPMAAYGGYVLHSGDGPRLVGFVSLLVAMSFACLGINAILRSMKALKMMERHAIPGGIVQLEENRFETVIKAYYGARGYYVEEPGGDPAERHFDLIASHKKEKILIRSRDWAEKSVGIESVRKLYGAKRPLKASHLIIYTSGKFDQDALDWGRRQGIEMVEGERIESEIISACVMAKETTPKVGAKDADPVPHPAEETGKIPLPNSSSSVAPILFLDVAAIEKDASLLSELLVEHPDWKLVLSTGKDMPESEMRARLSSMHDRLSGRTPDLPQYGASARYYEIMAYLAAHGGPSAPWVALDTHPEGFPESCIELAPVQRQSGITERTLSNLEKQMSASISRLSRISRQHS